MYIIEVTEQKAEKLKGYAEEILQAGGRMMSCLQQMCEEAEMNEGYGERSHFMDAGGGMKRPIRNPEMEERRPNAGGYQGGLGFRRGGGMGRRMNQGEGNYGGGYGDRYQWADPYYE